MPIFSILLAFALLLMGGCAAERPSTAGNPPAAEGGPGASGDRALPPGPHELTLRHEGRIRRYLVDVPPAAATGAGPFAVVLAFHGGGGNASQFRNSNGLLDLSRREGFVLVHPDGTGRLRLHTWNAGSCCGSSADEQVDDVGFVEALLDSLALRVAIDADKVYATGHSNGGMMSYRLAEDIPERLAAIAPVGGARLNRPGGGAGVPVPILHVHSVDDPRALYAGGVGPPFPFTNRRVEHPSVDEVLAHWREVNGCTGAPEARETRTAPAPAAGDRAHTATLLSWEPCASGAPVLHWRLEGPGHGWPGDSARPIRQEIIGPPTSVILAAEEVWAFFEGRSR
jgi:polyhydroxybutyrate depolymerase